MVVCNAHYFSCSVIFSSQSVYCCSIQVPGTSVLTKNYLKNVLKSPISFSTLYSIFSFVTIYYFIPVLELLTALIRCRTYICYRTRCYFLMSVAFTSVIKSVVPVKYHFRFGDYIPSQYLF